MRRLLGIIALLVLGVTARGETAGERSVLDPVRDPRLARRVALRSEAIPVHRVLERLGRHSGVSLQASGTVGDERLVAFVPDAPLAEVLTRIAELYRLDWSRGAGDRPAYRLYKRPAVARQEQTLREKAVRTVLERLAARVRAPLAATGEPFERENPWRPLFPAVLPLLEARSGMLIREGFAHIPLGSLPKEQRDALVARMQPVIDSEHQKLQRLAQAFRAQRAPGDVEISFGGENQPPADARECTLTAEIVLYHDLQVVVGLKTPHGSWSRWLSEGSDRLDREGRELYAEHRPATPSIPLDADAPVGPLTAEPADPFERRAALPKRTSDRKGDWIGELGRLSDGARIAVYADCYANYLEGIHQHPRAAFVLPEAIAPRAALDGLCFPLGSRGTQRLEASSFWWRQKGAALIRSRRWVWESGVILPSLLMEQIAGSLRRSRHLEPADLGGLAALSMLQVQGTGFVERSMDAWQRAVRIASRLSIPARQAALTKGVAWKDLSLQDQATVRQFLPPDADPVTYRSRFETSVHDFPDQGGTVVSLALESGLNAGQAIVHLPLSGVGVLPRLEPRGLIVGDPVPAPR